jgi:glycosyltransferase involved in cell wall biosynthesis
MKFGIALATYNGARFLREQLESLLRQSRHPDHVVISDDSSGDDTLGIAEWFKRRAPYRVDILGNDKRLGVMENFLRATSACEADFIAFCDQDDIWMPAKLELCEQALGGSRAFAAIHAIKCFGPTVLNNHDRSRYSIGSGSIDGLHAPPDWVVLGMAMVVRKDVFQAASQLKSLWEPRFDSIAKRRPVSLLDHWSHTHDMYAFTTARLLGKVTLLKNVLAYHREHQENYSAGRSSWRQESGVEEGWGKAYNHGYRVLSAFCRDFAEVLEGSPCTAVLSEARQLLATQHYRRWSDLWQRRAELHEDGAPLAARIVKLGELCRDGAYRGHFNRGLGKRSLAKDTLTAFGMRPMDIFS